MIGWIKAWRKRRYDRKFALGFGWVLTQRFLYKRNLVYIRTSLGVWDHDAPNYAGARDAIDCLVKANHRKYELYSKLASVGLLDSQVKANATFPQGHVMYDLSWAAPDGSGRLSSDVPKVQERKKGETP